MYCLEVDIFLSVGMIAVDWCYANGKLLTSSGSPSFSTAYHTCSEGRINKEGSLPRRIPGQQACSTSSVSGWRLWIKIIPQCMEVMIVSFGLILHYFSRKHFHISLIKCFLKISVFFTNLSIISLAVASSIHLFVTLGCIPSWWFSVENKTVYIGKYFISCWHWVM